MYRARRMLPSTWKEWRADEEYAATMYRKLEALDELRQFAGDLTPADREAWSRTLNRMIAEEAVTPLRVAAVEATQWLPLELVREGLSRAQKDASPTVRVAACEAWGKRDGSVAVEVLAEVLGSDTELDVQLAAAKALGRFKTPQAVAALGRVLESKDPALQHRAMRSLAQATGVEFGSDVAAWQGYLRGEVPAPRRESSSLVRLPLPWPLR